MILNIIAGIWYVILGLLTLIAWKKIDEDSLKKASDAFPNGILMLAWPLIVVIGGIALALDGVDALLEKF